MSDDLKRVLADGYTFVRSLETTQSISALTLDHLLQDAINDLQQGATTPIIDSQGNQVGSRISQYDQLTALQTSIDSAIQAIQAAGSDPAKLAALGMTPDNQPTVSSSSPSTSESSGT